MTSSSAQRARLLAAAAALAPRGGRALDGQGPRLRPRRRAEPVRRLRLRQARDAATRRSSPTTTRAPKLGQAPAGKVRVLLGAAEHGRLHAAPPRLRQASSKPQKDYRFGARGGGVDAARRRRRTDRRLRHEGKASSGGSRSTATGRYRGEPRRDASRRRLAGDQPGRPRATTSRAWSRTRCRRRGRASAAGAGGRGALLRARDQRRRRRLRPLRRHPQPGLRRQVAPRPRRPTGRSKTTARRGRQVQAARSRRPTTSRPRAAGPRTPSSASPAAARCRTCGGQGPLRRRVARPPLDGDLLRRRDGVEARGLFSGKLQGDQGHQDGVSPRIVKARVVGSGGSSTVTGDVLRSPRPASTWARFKSAQRARIAAATGAGGGG